MPGLLGFYGSSVLHLQYDENSSPNGVITIRGDPKKARECKDGNAAFAEAVLHAQEYQEIKKSIDPSEMPATKKEVTKPNLEFKASKETKKTPLKDDDPSKVTQIGVGLDSCNTLGSALCKFQQFSPNPHINDSKMPTKHLRAGGKRSNIITQ